MPDPRVEDEDHYYRAAHTKLLDLGLVPHLLSESVIRSLLAVAELHAARIAPEAILPTVDWRRTGSRVGAA
jgi:UDP-sulfoquinovose synthase